MKKSSLFVLSIASLVALVGCNKGSTPKGKSVGLTVATTMYKELMGEEGELSKNPAVHDDNVMIDVTSEENTADIYKIEDTKDSYEFIFSLGSFTKTGVDEYTLSGSTATFTLEQLNIVANNIMYAFMSPEDEEEAEEAFTYDAGHWACAAVYEPLEEDPDTGSLIRSYCIFINALDDEGEVDQERATVQVNFYFFVFDEADASTGITYSYLFCDTEIIGSADFDK